MNPSQTPGNPLRKSIEIIRRLEDLARQNYNTEILDGLQELRGHLSDLSDAAIASRDELSRLTAENNDLKRKLEEVTTRQKLSMRKGILYENELPVCRRCYNNDRQIKYLKPNISGSFVCLICGSVEVEPPEPVDFAS